MEQQQMALLNLFDRIASSSKDLLIMFNCAIRATNEKDYRNKTLFVEYNCPYQPFSKVMQYLQLPVFNGFKQLNGS